MKLGAQYEHGHCTFTVWAPGAEQMAVHLLSPRERILPMMQFERGYWQVAAEDVEPGSLYLLGIDDALERPDPASFHQPEGVHGPSAVVDHAAFHWSDSGWNGRPLKELVLYELHVGTFTPEGTFAAIIPRLAALRELGITAIELMPVAQFPGRHNWGYDGVFPFAVQHSYGGPDGLKRLVDACHGCGMAVILDVVYNHLGPEGNYLRDFGPYFTDRYRTPWGEAVNFDGRDSDEVRRYFIENALHWQRHYHMDGLRLDAVHAIFDFSARPFLQELTEEVEKSVCGKGRSFHLIAESDLNDVRLIRPRDTGGYGLDVQYNEDFHHALHSLLTDENQGYYLDFGRIEDLATALRQGFVYDWRYSVYRGRHHGSSSAGRPPWQLLLFSQNHDQVGNRRLGERLSTLAGFEKAKLAAASVLLSPGIPLLFMGEEYAEKAPFLYFADFSDPDLVEAVRQGRREEFRSFDWQEEAPDPHDPQVFTRSRIDWSLRNRDPHRVMLTYYSKLLSLRRSIPALEIPDQQRCEVAGRENDRTLWFLRGQGKSQVLCLMNFNGCESCQPFPEQENNSHWHKILDSADPEWQGPGSSPTTESACEKGAVTLAPWSCQLYLREGPKEAS
jgi:maltooligosyltrehalose trehalohydrolase